MEGKRVSSDIKGPFVTIAMPFYNSEKYLEFAIKSVINQSYSNWELLLMDDGGTDNSRNIAEKYSCVDKRIRILSDGYNRGLVYRLNQSVSEAKGDYYARMDDDDIMVYSRIEKQVQFLENRKDVDVVGSDIYVIDTANKVFGKYQISNRTPRSVADIISSGGFVHPTVMGRTTWFKDNPYDARMLREEDQALWMMTVDKSSFHSMPEPLLFYRAIGMPVSKKSLKGLIGKANLCYYVLAKYHHKKRLAVKSFVVFLLKTMIYSIIGLLNLSDTLVRRRYKSMSDSERAHAKELICKSIK